MLQGLRRAASVDKKAVQILNRLMDDQKKYSVSAEELAYARKMGVVVERIARLLSIRRLMSWSDALRLCL